MATRRSSAVRGSTGAQRDRELLRQPCDVEEGVSTFGSARVREDHRWYGLCRQTAVCLPAEDFITEA